MANVTIKDYQDWLKNNSKAKVPKKGEELSAYDEQANRTLYNQYVKQAELLNQKNEAEARVQVQKESALRDNYIAQAQAQKKAEDAVKMQGVATGVSESGLIDLYAQGAAARAGIINASDSAKNDIFSEYRRAIAESNAETNAALAEIDASREETDKANAVNALAYALENYNADKYDFEDLKAAYEKYGASLDEVENYDIVQDYQNALKDYDKATIDVNREGFDVSEFGRFFGMGREDSNQHDYLEQIVADAQAGKIKKGQYIVPNLGKHLDKRSYVYQYLGNGRFKKIDREEFSLGEGFLHEGSQLDRNLDVYTPDGYEFKDGWWRRLWGTSKVKKD